MKNWLSTKLLNDNFPWDNPLELKPEKFIKAITIHDSEFIKIVLNSPWENSLTIAVKWDTFWNKDIVKHPGPKVSEWPVLIIKVLEVINISFHGQDNLDIVTSTISDFYTVKENTNYTSEILSIEGVRIVIKHTGNIQALCYSPDGELMEISKKFHKESK